MMHFYHGERSPYDEADFITKRMLVEVKKCNMFVHYRARTTISPHLGRFVIDTDNHVALFLRAVQLKKRPVYLFVVRIPGQPVLRKFVDWEKVIVPNRAKQKKITIREIFWHGAA